MNTVMESEKSLLTAEEVLVRTHAAMVRRIAWHLLGRLPQHVQLDDLIQAGMEGLIEAARHYDATRGASFETYAGIRIRGHMLDEVRRNDWVPRSVHRTSRAISAAVREVENRLGRDARDHEVAEALGVSMDEYFEMLTDSSGGNPCGFEDLGVSEEVIRDEGNGVFEPQVRALRDDLMAMVTEVIHHLPTRERLVLSLYYEQDLNLREIGEVLDVSESRVSQILTQATLRLRARLPEDTPEV